VDVELTRVARAHRRLLADRVERDEAVVAAALSGHSLRAIAQASGVQLKQVHRIVMRHDAELDGRDAAPYATLEAKEWAEGRGG